MNTASNRITMKKISLNEHQAPQHEQTLDQGCQQVRKRERERESQKHETHVNKCEKQRIWCKGLKLKIILGSKGDQLCP